MLPYSFIVVNVPLQYRRNNRIASCCNYFSVSPNPTSESLKQLAVDGLLNRHLLLSLKNSPPDISLVDKAQKVLYFLEHNHRSNIYYVAHTCFKTSRLVLGNDQCNGPVHLELDVHMTTLGYTTGAREMP